MNQTCKVILAIFMVALSNLCVNTCPENHFQLDSLCCYNCPEGWYVTKNCSKEPGANNGVSCEKCSGCEDIGQITVSNCTQFADTQCMDQPSPTPILVVGQLSPITLYGCSAIVVAVLMLAVIVAVCLIKISKSDESSAGEPLNIKDAETA